MIVLSKKICCLCALLIVLLQNSSFAQASFTATLTPKVIGKNETAELRLVVENAKQVDQITPPSFKDFIVVSGPNQESGMESINGVTRQYIGLTYVIAPKAKGSYTISSALARADGKNLRSNPVTLQVTNSSATTRPSNNLTPFSGFSPYTDQETQSAYKDYILKKGENVAEKISRNIFIKVDVNKHSCFVGEPVIVLYKLYTRLKSESSITKNPAFNGFSVIDLMPPGNTYYSIEKLDGREYNVYTLRKTQLYPLQTGSIELESTEVDNNIHFIKEEYLSHQRNELLDLFRDFAQTSIPAEGMYDEKVTLRSKPVFIDVKPLPEAGKPANFKGAVGDFTIVAAVEKNSFTTDDAGKLRIILSGEGNMTLVNTPDVAWPVGIENYEPVAKEQLNKYAVPVSGTKIFEYPFTVEKPGNYTLPAINFSYFDVKKGTYKTISTNTIDIKVTKGTGKRPAIANSKSPTQDKRNFFEMLFTNRWLIIVPLAILLITGLFVWLRKENKRDIKQARQHIPVKPVIPQPEPAPINFKPLSITEEKLTDGEPRPFYEALNSEIRVFLADKLRLPVETINKKRIAEEADKKGIPVHTCLQIQHLLDDIEWQLYTPFSDQDKMQQVYNDADNIVHTLNAMAL
ncbi:MAG: BatD family protein [Ferruginibacter sp.]